MLIDAIARQLPGALNDAQSALRGVVRRRTARLSALHAARGVRGSRGARRADVRATTQQIARWRLAAVAGAHAAAAARLAGGPASDEGRAMRRRRCGRRIRGGLTANDAHQGAPCAARYGLRTRNTKGDHAMNIIADARAGRDRAPQQDDPGLRAGRHRHRQRERRRRRAQARAGLRRRRDRQAQPRPQLRRSPCARSRAARASSGRSRRIRR